MSDERWYDLFRAALALEKRGDWAEAIAIYESIAAKSQGTQEAIYASNCAKRLRGFQAIAQSVPAEVDLSAKALVERPQKRAVAAAKFQLNRVAIGLGFMLASITMVVVLFVGTVGVFLLAILQPSDTIVMPGLLFIVGFSVTIVATATILDVLGPCLCLAAPREAKATGYILLSVSASALRLVLTILGLPLTGAIVPISFWVAYIAFVLFVKRLSEYLGRPYITKLAVSTCHHAVIVALAGLVFLGSGLFLARTPVPNRSLEDIFRLSFVVLLITLTLALLRYARLLTFARRSILQLIHEEG